MQYNEAQKAVLTDFDEGTYSHLVKVDPRSHLGQTITDPLINTMLSHAGESKRPCELASAMFCLDQISLAKQSRDPSTGQTNDSQDLDL